MKNKILLKGGFVLDPSQKICEEADVCIADGKIVEITPNVKITEDMKVVSVTGCYVVPGLIDCHCHVHPSFPTEHDGLATVNAEAHMFQSGVTTAVDAGTCGTRDFITFKEQVIDKSKVRILAYINIASGGMVHMETEQNIKEFHPELTAAMATTFSDCVVGIKTAHYWVGCPFDKGHPAWASVDACIEAGNLCKKPVMIDFQPNLPERTYEELVLKRMRPGDIHTHMYAQQFPILDENGRIRPYIFEARERGVIFDLGHGAGSFWFRNAIPSLEQGYYPDTISTDLYLDNVAGPVINLLHVMSKYVSMGMPFEEVIYRTTKRPAEIIGHEELGDLKIGSCADVTVLRMHEGKFSYADSGRARMNGNKRLECIMTIREGKIVYDPMALSMPEWKDAPESYWVAPGIIK